MPNVNNLDPVIILATEDECVPENVVRNSRGVPLRNDDGFYITSGEEKLDPGPQTAKTQALTAFVQVPKSFLSSAENPSPPGGIGRLNTLHVKAVMTMIGKAVSGFSYNLITAADYVGKYQLSAQILAELGYIKPEFITRFGRGAVKKNAAWTGKDNVSNIFTWFNSPGVQEKSMYELLIRNYDIMVKNGAIKEKDNLCTIAGMMCVAHILGPDDGSERFPGAKRWRATGGGQDINGNYGAYFFTLGRYAIDVLASKRQ